MSKTLFIPDELKILDLLRHRLTPAGWEAYRAETSLLHPGEFYWNESETRTKYRGITCPSCHKDYTGEIFPPGYTAVYCACGAQFDVIS